MPRPPADPQPSPAHPHKAPRPRVRPALCAVAALTLVAGTAASAAAQEGKTRIEENAKPLPLAQQEAKPVLAPRQINIRIQNEQVRGLQGPATPDNPARARWGPIDDAAFTRLIADLDSRSWEAREAASMRLAQDPGIDLARLETALRANDLSHEQRQRLSTAAFERFRTSDRGAMGVSFDDSLMDLVAIRTVESTFPAAAVLEPGDIVLSVDGVNLQGPYAWETLRWHILARNPGDTLRLTLRKAEKRVDVDLTLGNFSQLRTPPSAESLAGAWRVRTGQPLLFAADAADETNDLGAALIPAGLSIDDWNDAEDAAGRRRSEMQTNPGAWNPRGSVVPGGQVRNTGGNEVEAGRFFANRHREDFQIGFQAQRALHAGRRPAPPTPLEDHIRQLEEGIRQTRAFLREPMPEGIQRDGITEIERRIPVMERLLVGLRAELEDRNAERAEPPRVD